MDIELQRKVTTRKRVTLSLPKDTMTLEELETVIQRVKVEAGLTAPRPVTVLMAFNGIRFEFEIEMMDADSGSEKASTFDESELPSEEDLIEPPSEHYVAPPTTTELRGAAGKDLIEPPPPVMPDDIPREFLRDHGRPRAWPSRDSI